MSKTLCAACSSPRLIHIRKDMDWGYGGDLSRINQDSDYLIEDPHSIDEFDIEFYYCLACKEYDALQVVDV